MELGFEEKCGELLELEEMVVDLVQRKRQTVICVLFRF